MLSRKSFLKSFTLGGLAPFTSWSFPKKAQKPIVISTWRHGLAANEAAWKVLQDNGLALDAVEQGVRVTEADPEIQTVGLGGFPDRDGHVTLDACIMDHEDRCGSVACLEDIVHAISVARKVKEDTPHLMLVGEGALQFALDSGFEKQHLLTVKSKKDWQSWKQKAHYHPEINIENHDTIGMLALDTDGRLSGACTTSGTAFKMHGRVGDSPLIGAGLFVDSEVGAAAATGLGEEVIRTSGSHTVVENMRHGDDPETACRKAVERMVSKNKNASRDDFQVGFIALNKHGQVGGFSIQPGFDFAVFSSKGNQLIKSKHWVKK